MMTFITKLYLSYVCAHFQVVASETHPEQTRRSRDPFAPMSISPTDKWWCVSQWGLSTRSRRNKRQDSGSWGWWALQGLWSQLFNLRICVSEYENDWIVFLSPLVFRSMKTRPFVTSVYQLPLHLHRPSLSQWPHVYGTHPFGASWVRPSAGHGNEMWGKR